MAEGTHHHAPYFLIFIALCICTILSVVADVLQPSSKLVLIVIVLAIATAKALFVMAYFMHLKFEGRWKYLLLSPTIILACGIPLALMPDIGVHYYTDVAPQYVESDEPDEPETPSPETPEPHH